VDPWSVVDHPLLSHTGFPMDGPLVGAGSVSRPLGLMIANH
jgi:hypothetical protein